MYGVFAVMWDVGFNAWTKLPKKGPNLAWNAWYTWLWWIEEISIPYPIQLCRVPFWPAPFGEPRIPGCQVSSCRMAQSFSPLHDTKSTSAHLPAAHCSEAQSWKPGFPQQHSRVHLKLGRGPEVGAAGIVGLQSLKWQLWQSVLEFKTLAVDSKLHFPALKEAAAFLAGQVAVLFWNFCWKIQP